MTPMNYLAGCDKWHPWMVNCVHWDKEDQTYVGTSPDKDEICREKDPTVFLLLFEEANIEWYETQ